MADSRKPRYKESDLRGLDHIQISSEILRAIEAFRANNPRQSSLSDADIIRYCYFNFYSDINPDTFIALLGVKSNGSAVDDTATAETAPNPPTGKDRFFRTCFERVILLLFQQLYYIYFFVYLFFRLAE